MKFSFSIYDGGRGREEVTLRNLLTKFGVSSIIVSEYQRVFKKGQADGQTDRQTDMVKRLGC